MIIVNMHEAKSTLSKLVKAVVEDGEVVRIARDGKPVVELRAISGGKDPLIQNPRLKGITYEDPSLPTEPEGWD
ncbi:MAG TPA: type II toxin-antitoxin system Phd/YefM family antitoxin [bacterium]|nr:type II toxin-antitoxin system Phd/YefM family antitoxin [bacterium]